MGGAAPQWRLEPWPTGIPPLPHGAYTTLRTYQRTGVLLLDEHLDRLESSARRLGHDIKLDRAALRDILCQIVSAPELASGEQRLRLVLDCAEEVGRLWLALEPLATPSPTEQRAGVAVVSRPMRRENPLAKDIAFVAASQEARRLIGGRINEVLMVDERERVLEGLSSNFFGVRDGRLFTAGESVLPGLTRSLVMDEAAAAGIEVRLEALLLEELPTLEEAFISSTSRAVLPVVEVDGRKIGSGAPGPITQRLARSYAARVWRELEWLCGPPGDNPAGEQEQQERSHHG